MNSLTDILQVTLGVSSCGAVAWLGFKLLQIMTRHNILLAGQCLEDAPSSDQERHQHAQYPRRFRYRLRIQSLEATRTAHPLQVTVRGIPSGSNDVLPTDHVWVIAGWKSVEVVRELGANREQNNENEVNPLNGPYVWRAEFPELPAFDAWSFDIVLPCERLEFSLAFAGIEQRKWLAPTFGPYFAPDQITVFSSDREEPRVKGAVTVPRPVVPVILSTLGIAVYVLILGLSRLRIEWGTFRGLDIWMMVSEVVLIWVGYAMIKRPVYPVISGYRFLTPPWPNVR
jgi:hypothetical protein